ncbi:MAG: glycosyl hydrolase family 95 catalytic domain-containing protein [Phycisphaerae bacterium]
MMRQVSTVTIAAILAAAVGARAQDQHPGDPGKPLLEVDRAAIVSRADLTYDLPADRSEAGMPIGNGRMGSLLWTSPSALQMEINRDDVFGVDRDTTSFPEKHTDYCGGCAFVDLDVGGDVFAGPAFKQHLSVENGRVTTNGSGVTIRAIALHDHDAFALQVTDNREMPQPITLKLRMLRPPVEKRFQHTATSTLLGGGAYGNRILLTQRFEEPEPASGDFYCASAVAAEVTGRDARIQPAGDQEIRLVTPPENGTFLVLISSAASMQKNNNATAPALQILDEAHRRNFDQMQDSNEQWWRDFWTRSTLHLHSPDGVADHLEQNFTYYLYLMASTSRGNYPVKFNGMMWTTGGDKRQWGSQFWGANQSCLYNTALLASNHLDLYDPMFKMYRAQLPSLEQAAREQWGSQGAFIPETGAFNGLAPLPDDIAAEMRDLYLMRKPWSQRSQKFMDYATARMGYSSRWNFIGNGEWHDGKYEVKIRSDSPFGPVTHTFARGAKIAYEYWTRYQYTGDTAWLRDVAYPVIRDAAEFYRHFPNLVKESDGLYHIHHVNANEALWDGTDTDEEIAGIMGILPTAIRASEILNLDAPDRAAWQEILTHLAPLPRSDTAQVKSNRTTPVWVKAHASEGFRHPVLALPDSNTLPEWFFDLCNLDSPPPMKAIANATFDAYSHPNPDQQREDRPPAATRPAATQPRRRPPGISVLSKMPLAAAKLGRPDDLKRLLPMQSFSAEVPVLANRMDLREGPQTTSAQRLGNAADALQSALCQSLPGTPAGPFAIRLFPAWPKDWDAEFTFLQRGGFLVSSAMQHGTIPFVQIRSQLGGPCPLHNPWNQPLAVYRNGVLQPAPAQDGDLLTLSTQKGDLFTLLPQGKAPAALQVP